MSEPVSGYESKASTSTATLDQKVRASLVSNHLPCALAFGIAHKLGMGRRQVGDAANRLQARIVDCQLGCFVIRKATHDELATMVQREDLTAEIGNSLVNNRLPCAVAFKIAAKLRVSPREVGDSASKQGVKVVNCQLGCF